MACQRVDIESARTVISTSPSRDMMTSAVRSYMRLVAYLRATDVCPLHGHCYGFHIISGSEGRKDPYASLYSYLECPPKTIYYDYSCNLQEYSLNWESGYYQDVNFFHDIFHGYSHHCSETHDTKRLDGIQKANTEICEQFNSFLQCIKYTSKQMRQDHFVFFLQFFIQMWNDNKKAENDKKVRIKQQGLL